MLTHRYHLRSAPKIFNAIPDALQWIARRHGVSYLWHYLDDLITCGLPHSDECGLNLQLLLAICRMLAIPIAEEKLEGPTTLAVSLLRYPH